MGNSALNERSQAGHLITNRRLRLCRIVTVPLTFQALLWEQLRAIAAHGVDLTVVSSSGPELEAVAADIGAAAVGIPMERRPAPLSDLRSLFRLTRFFCRRRFDIIHSSTPKAGLLTALAGRLARVPVRIHTFTGQPWVELTGVRRQIPRECDRITATLATQCYADSPSQRAFLIQEKLVACDKIAVVGAGSISGVDLTRFSLTTWGGPVAVETRRELGIPESGLIIVYVGRLTKDKGITELVAAFESIVSRNAIVHLVLVGPFEAKLDPLPSATVSKLQSHSQIHCVGFTTKPEKYLAAADIFCLPSYREGFGSVVVEAAAMELPAVVTRVTGLVDAVVEGATGLIVPPKNADALAQAIQTLVDSPALRESLGRAGRQRVVRHYDSRLINEAVVAEYFRLMEQVRPLQKQPCR